MNARHTLALVLFALVLTLGPAAAAEPLYPHARATSDNATALDRYVAAADDAYAWEVVDTMRGSDWTGYIIDLTSQRWGNPDTVNRTLWKHWLTVVVPDNARGGMGFLMIGGGRNATDPPSSPDFIVVNVARGTGSVAATLHQVPNQPLSFADEGRNRSEDALIAYTWAKYMDTGDDQWPLRLPMTKAAVRAMDTVQALCRTQLADPLEVDAFFVAGASKRGWTTWTTAAVDRRVTACSPIVIDMLNLVPSFRHHWSVYGFWAPAVKDYEEMDIMARMETPEFAALMEIVEPYHYRERLTMPKYIMNACGDQFFLPDSSQFYVRDLEGPVWLRYVPNTGHSMLGTDAAGTVTAFYRAVLNGDDIPAYDWEFSGPNTVRVTAEGTPTAVKQWQAHNPDTRDFRVDVLGKVWTAADLAPGDDGSYVATVETPDTGWRAYMVELSYEGRDGGTLKFTTPVRVVPEDTPFTYTPEPDPAPGFLSR